MDCNEARLLLDARHDRELSAAESRRIEQHLSTCAECRREAQALRAVSEATRTADYFAAPDALRARLVAALPETHSERPRSRPFGWTWGAGRAPGGERGANARGRAASLGWPAGIAAAAAVLAVSAALVLHRPGGTQAPFVEELVASHVRAQLSGHDIDVISSDQHTVKPWFNGRLDYAPPVEDLADQGFALTGGRLDYIDHRRVAVLVYRYRKHVVDVYVMPETDAAARRAPASLTSDGYALASWRDRGMTWWAVSDAEPAVLDALRAALAARLRG